MFDSSPHILDSGFLLAAFGDTTVLQAIPVRFIEELIISIFISLLFCHSIVDAHMGGGERIDIVVEIV